MLLRAHPADPPPEEPTFLDHIWALAGPYEDLSVSEARGGIYATYESEFDTQFDLQWDTLGDQWDANNQYYYDRIKIMYVRYARTGDTKWRDRARLLAVNYRDEYVVPSDYQTPAHALQATGLALHYLDTGDEASRTAVGRQADYHTGNSSVAHVSDSENINVSARTVARAMEAQRVAAYVDAPTQTAGFGGSWATRFATASPLLVDVILDLQDRRITGAQADGSGGSRRDEPVWGRFRYSDYYIVPFMDALLNHDMAQYHRNSLSADSRIIQAVRNSIHYIWKYAFEPEDYFKILVSNNPPETTADSDNYGHSFQYIEANSWVGHYSDPVAEPETKRPIADDSNFMLAALGYLYYVTGDTTYRDIGDIFYASGRPYQVTAGAGAKQLNARYTFSPMWHYLRHATPLATPAWPVCSAVPTISGTAQVGQTLTAGNGTYDKTVNSRALQWIRNYQEFDNNVELGTGSSYVVQAGDVGQKIYLIETATGDGGAAVPARSLLTAAVVS